MAHLLALEHLGKQSTSINMFLEWVVKGWGLSPNSRKKSGDYFRCICFLIYVNLRKYTFLKYIYAVKYVCTCLCVCVCLRIGMLRFPTNGGASCG